MPDDREPFTPPNVPQPDFAGDRPQDDGAELANEILEGEAGSAPPSIDSRARAREEAPKTPEPLPSMRELLDERDRRIKAEADLKAWTDWKAEVERSQQQRAPQAPQIDPYLQPAEYVEHQIQQRLNQALTPIGMAMSQLIARNNLAEAGRQFGQEIADTAYKEFDKAIPQMHRADFEGVMGAPNPFVAAVQWYRRRELLTALGDDPALYEQKMREKILAELEQERRQGRAAPQPTPQDRVEPQPPSYESQPRDDAGRFQSPTRATSLPSVNRIGTANAAAPRGISNLSDEDLVDEILSAPYPNGSSPSR